MTKRSRTGGSGNGADVTWVQDHLAAASLAYKSNNESDNDDLVKLSEGWKYHKTIEGKSGIKLKVWVSPTNGNVLVAFRGTSSMKELKLDATIGATAFQSSKGENVGYIYKGFATAWEDIKPSLERELKVLRSTSFIPDGSVLQFAGHSLGGAMGEIASTYFADAYPNVQVSETSVGAPTPGDKHFGEYSRSRVNLQRMRIVAGGDPVSNIKIPGMEFVEQSNVLYLGDEKKRRKNNAWEAFKTFIGANSPALAMGNQLYDSYTNHSLASYEETLMRNFQDSSVLSLQSDPSVQIQQKEEQYTMSKNSEIPQDESGDCMCECHIYDLAISNGRTPPLSLGTTPTPQAPDLSSKIVTNDPMLVKETAALNTQVNMPQRDLEIQSKEVDQTTLANELDPSDIMDMVQEGLEAEKTAEIEKEKEKMEKKQETINKLQEQYANLTNQHDAENWDPVTTERNKWGRVTEDLDYFDSRIQLEITNPQFVPDDADGKSVSRDKAIALKNKLNKIYSLIQSVKSKQYAARLNEDYKDPEEAQIQKEMVEDQARQMQQAQKDNDLNPEEQPNDFIFDVDTLRDLDQEAPQTVSLKQIQKWFEYTGYSPNELYNAVKETVTSQYKQDRMKELQRQTQELRVKSSADIKVKIDQLTKESGAGLDQKFYDLQKSKTEIMKNLVQSQDFVALVRDKKVDIKKTLAKLTAESDPKSIREQLFGYDNDTATQAIRDDMNKALLESSRGVSSEIYKNNLDLYTNLTNQNLMYPWINADNFRNLYQLYKDNPEELAKKAQELRPPLDPDFVPDSVQQQDNAPIPTLQKDEKLLSKMVEELPKQPEAKIKPIAYYDYYGAEKSKLEKQYNDPEQLKQMFEKWNGGAPDKTKNFFTALGNVFTSLPGTGLGTSQWLNDIRTLQHGGDKQYGWFDKDGNYLGAAASPDFSDFARAHPQLGFKYVTPETTPITKALDTVNTALGGVAEGMLGINPNDMKDSIRDIANEGPSKSAYSYTTGELIPERYQNSSDNYQGSENDQMVAGGMEQMLMYHMLAGGQQQRTIVGETPPLGRTSANFKKNIPLPSKFSSRTSRLKL